jgi:isoleucyl-tRNA synthetase
MRFDAIEQRLRLIEVLDFSKVKLLYKNDDISPRSNNQNPHETTSISGPKFRGVYKIFGPTTPGEYIPASDKDEYGTYVLSYPGVAFSFPLKSGTFGQSATWSSTVSLLSSSAAMPATSMAVFCGESWQDVRHTLFTADLSSTTNFLRMPIPPGMKREHLPKEVELARIFDRGRVELVRKDAPSFWLVMGETTPQDLITELGPPDGIHRKNDRRVNIHRARKGSSVGHSRRNSSATDVTGTSPAGPGGRRVGFAGFSPEDYHAVEGQSGSAAETDTDDDYDDDADAKKRERTEQVFYNYYSHGFDILVSNPSSPSWESPTAPDPSTVPYPYSSKEGTVLADVLPRVESDAFIPRNHLTATKIIFHGNVPGSWPFNRHRRIRWTLESVPTESSPDPLTSETEWQDVQGRLQEVFKEVYSSEEEQRSASLPMVVNRGWGREDVSVDSEWGVVGGWEDSGRKGGGGGGGGSEMERIGGTEVYGFPGLIFEVLKNGVVSSVMVS